MERFGGFDSDMQRAPGLDSGVGWILAPPGLDPVLLVHPALDSADFGFLSHPELDSGLLAPTGLSGFPAPPGFDSGFPE